VTVLASSRVEAESEKALSVAAWAAILAASGLVEIVWRLVLGRPESVWIAVIQLCALLTLFVLVRIWNAVEALTPLVTALAALNAGFVVLFLLERTMGFTAWSDRGPQYEVVPAESALLCLPTLAMLAAAFGYGLRRRELFLTAGSVRAPSRIPGTSRRVAWNRVGPVAIVVFAIPLCVQLALTTHTHVHSLLRVGEFLPLGVAFAAANALQEELRFRAVPLALAVPVVGGERAIWMTATAFGLAHWFGHPRGPSGVALTIVAGLFLAKAMLETRGLFWPWAIHAVQDVLIFAFLVLASG
jgi:membrane protease YdiL (CAAX protease family)